MRFPIEYILLEDRQYRDGPWDDFEKAITREFELKNRYREEIKLGERFEMPELTTWRRV